ncbi:hypothetical protein DUI87_00674 [Hirundo rustica rustica]|uniref:Uncharacterized protein n=1 Tax=Hirundo rustica rustica TaxID=333673 RepID=A0A3M0L9T8_HIRRU|nr:hypothetical protein DUI87_00674 [Hirundo rustica rustica]
MVFTKDKPCLTDLVVFYDEVTETVDEEREVVERERPGNHKSVSLNSVPEKIIEKIFLEVVLRHVEDREVTPDSQHSFTKASEYLIQLKMALPIAVVMH